MDEMRLRIRRPADANPKPGGHGPIPTPKKVLRRVSTTPEHPGWVFIKCSTDGVCATLALVVLSNSASFTYTQIFIVQDGCNFWYWKEEYIDLLIERNLIDVRALVA